MGNILVLGVGPLPYEQTDKLFAPGLRTWQIGELLAKKHHRVTIGLINFGDFDAAPGRHEPAKREDLGDNVVVYRFKYHPENTIAVLSTLHMATKFSCIVSTTDIMNFVAASIRAQIPLWLDYNGDPFAEKQMQALVHQNDSSLRTQWDYYLPGLLAGDRFSCISTAQKCAMIGHLGFAGRLNEHNCGEDMVQIIPVCSRAMEHGIRKRYLGIKGHMIPASAFMVLWTGGYNTWCDIETLYDGLIKAMQADPSVFYVSTGGAIAGHDSETFQHFESLVENGPYKDRFLFLGWRATDEIPSIYGQADAAINCDRYSVEGEFGARNRIIDWIQFNVPVLTTKLCEFTLQMSERDLITTFEIGSPQSLCDRLLFIKSHGEAMKEKAVQAHAFFDSFYVEETIFKPLLNWAQNPVFAGDRQSLGDALAAEPEQGKKTSRPALPPAVSGLSALHADFLSRKLEPPKPKRSLRGLLRKMVPGRKK